MTIGEKIKEIRKEKNMTQKELAQRLNVSQANLAQYENGRRNPKLATVQKIADALEVAVSRLLTQEYVRQANITQKDIENWQSSYTSAYVREINNLLKLLNTKGQSKILEYTLDLTKIPEYRKDKKPD